MSRMLEYVRKDVNEWLERSLEEYYPVVFVDCINIKIHRKHSVACEAFYVALAVTEEGKREVLGVFNMPSESATGWDDIFCTGQPDYTVETAWAKWQEMCDRWGKNYRAIKRLRNTRTTNSI